MCQHRSVLVCLFAALLVLGGLAAQAQQAAKEPKTITENRALDQQLREAAIALDAEKLASFYWKGPEVVVVFPDGSVFKGWENVRQALQRLFGSLQSVQAEFSDLSYSVVGDGVVGSGNVRVRAQTKDGAADEFTYRFTSLRRKQAGKWVFVTRHGHRLPPPPLAASEPLYKRLGGYDAIAAVVDDFLPRLTGDPQLGRFFGGMSADSGQRVRQLIVEQLCAATGGPCLYVGRDMKTAHAGLGITGADWDAAVKHLVATLAKFRVPEREKNEVLAALTGLKPDIIEK